MNEDDTYESMGLGKDDYVVPTDAEKLKKQEDALTAMKNAWLFPPKKVDENLTPIPWSVINAKVFPEAPFRIKNLIPMGGFVILASVSGEKKSWLAMEMARSISENRNFLGQDFFTVNGGNVLYVDGENAESEISRRGKLVGLRDDTPHKLDFISADGLNLDDKDVSEDFIEMIEKEKYQVVIFDTLRAFGNGLDEDKAEHVRKFFNRFLSIKKVGITFIFLDHLRKPIQRESKTPNKAKLLGSQDKTASVETVLMLKSDAGTNEINVYQVKSRLWREINPFQVLMEDSTDENGIDHITFLYKGEIDNTDFKIDEAKDLILGMLTDHEGHSTNDFLDALQNQIGQRNTRAALKALVIEEVIELSKKGKENFYKLAPKIQEVADQGLLDDF